MARQATDPEVLALQIELQEAVNAGLFDLAETIRVLIDRRGGESQLQDLSGAIAEMTAALTAYFIAYSRTVKATQVQIAKAMVTKQLDESLPLLKRAGAPTSYQTQLANRLKQYPARVDKTFYTRPNDSDGQRFDFRIKTVRKDAETTVRNLMRVGQRKGLDARTMARQAEAYLKPEYGGPAKVSAVQLAREAAGMSKDQTPKIRASKIPAAALRIARSESGNTYRQAEVEMYEGTIFEEDPYDWLLSNSHAGRDTCDDLARNSPYKGNRRPHSHPNCVLPDTRMRTGKVNAAMRASYNGLVHEFTLKGGDILTVTPKHVFPTAGGWRFAESLNKGDKLFKVADLSVFDPENNYVPATAENIFNALSVASGVPAISVIPTAEDFHGDGVSVDGQIDVVRTDGLLVSDFEACADKPILDSVLVGGDRQATGLPGIGALDESLHRFLLATYGVMGWLGDASPELWRSAAIGELDSLVSGTDYNARLKQAASDGMTANAETKRNLLDGLPSGIATDKVVNVKSYFYSGHVYDFSTSSTLMAANNIVTSNCLCSFSKRPITVDQLKRRLQAAGVL